MKDCDHPKLQKIKKLSSVTIKCPDCKRDIFFLEDHLHDKMKEIYKTLPKNGLNPLEGKSDIAYIYGVPIFISKTEDEK